MTTRHTIAALLVGCAMASAFAQTPAAGAASTPNVDARQQRQHQRIEQGVASGELTRREAHRLHAQQRAIARAETRAGADGHVTAAERSRLHHLQDRASRDIHRQKHDRQHRPASAPQ